MGRLAAPSAPAPCRPLATLLAVAMLLAVAGDVRAAGIDDLAAMKERYRRPADIPFPRYNPYSREKAELGRILFFDPRLSGSGRIACATCHQPARGWSDGRAKALGDGGALLPRRTPTLLNLAWSGRFTWDGRADALEGVVLGPIQDPHEMNQPLDALVGKLSRIPGYGPLFEAAFPGQGITLDGIAQAIATFERTVVAGPAPFDRWIEGDEGAIGDGAKAGFVLFNTKANCAACHGGWNFTDGKFHDIGLSTDDVGRGRRDRDPRMTFAFKTPTLRDVAGRSPYMHTGAPATLAQVVEHYDSGFIRRPTLDPEIQPLRLTDQEKVNLVEFLAVLTGDVIPFSVPEIPQ